MSSNPRSAAPLTCALPGVRVHSCGEWEHVACDLASELKRQKEYERTLVCDGDFAVAGECYPCGSASRFRVDYRYAYPVDGRVTPNWREQLFCPKCGLNNRMRASIHLCEVLLKPTSAARILITEQMTGLCGYFSGKYPGVVGFEYLAGEVPFGQENAMGIRSETLTALTFGDESFDYVLSFEVLEHIPEYRRALSESCRVLRPGGALVFSVPFLIGERRNLVRARRGANEDVEHLLPPEYHGDPLSASGCLAFYHFGWELLDDARAIGFSDVAAYLYWSREFCYLGANQILFVGTK
jgi:hypothetical protein